MVIIYDHRGGADVASRQTRIQPARDAVAELGSVAGIADEVRGLSIGTAATAADSLSGCCARASAPTPA